MSRVVYVIEAKAPKGEWRAHSAFVDDYRDGSAVEQRDAMLALLLEEPDEPGELYREAEYEPTAVRR